MVRCTMTAVAASVIPGRLGTCRKTHAECKNEDIQQNKQKFSHRISPLNRYGEYSTRLAWNELLDVLYVISLAGEYSTRLTWDELFKIYAKKIGEDVAIQQGFSILPGLSLMVRGVTT